jgi:hypothetical protein
LLLIPFRFARGRFAKGRSGNPRGIRNPRRRVPDLLARPLSLKALSLLIDRKPHVAAARRAIIAAACFDWPRGTPRD